MEDWNSNRMTPFDQQISTQSTQMIKLLLPYLPPRIQRMLAVYIKFTELQFTISSFRSFRQTAHSTQDIIQEMKPYMPSSACESIDNILNLINMMELFQNMSASSDSDSDFDPMSMMQNMLTPEQQSMFEMYNTMFDTKTETQTAKGGETPDGLD